MAILSGKLRNKFTVQARTVTQDAHGGMSESWATAGTRWGEFVNSNSREFYQASQLHADITHLVRIRFFDGLNPDDRLTFDSRTFHILGVVDFGGMNWEHLITCREITEGA